jgi:hypothetical protein
MANVIDVESVDLLVLARQLRRLNTGALLGEVVGRTILRDGVVNLLACSELEAENLVETMISRGIIVRRRAERSDEVVEWQIRGNPDNAD